MKIPLTVPKSEVVVDLEQLEKDKKASLTEAVEMIREVGARLGVLHNDKNKPVESSLRELKSITKVSNVAKRKLIDVGKIERQIKALNKSKKK